MKIGVLGGSFNPPHYGHLLIAQQVLDFMGIDEVWLMPCFAHPFNKALAHADIRLKMLKLLETDRIKVSDFEIKQKKINYTYETLNLLSKEPPKNEFYWIIGQDQLRTIKEWKNWEDLIKKYKFIVFPREEDIDKLSAMVNMQFPGENNFIPVSFDNLATCNISSSMIRRRLKAGETIRFLVPERVEEYIERNHLYE